MKKLQYIKQDSPKQLLETTQSWLAEAQAEAKDKFLHSNDPEQLTAHLSAILDHVRVRALLAPSVTANGDDR